MCAVFGSNDLREFVVLKTVHYFSEVLYELFIHELFTCNCINLPILLMKYQTDTCVRYIQIYSCITFFEMLKTVKTGIFDYLKIVNMIIIPKSEQTLRKIVY